MCIRDSFGLPDRYRIQDERKSGQLPACLLYTSLVNLAASRILVADALDGQFAGLLADRCSDDVLGLLEIFHREILMNPVHDGVPEDLVAVSYTHLDVYKRQLPAYG